MEPLDAPGLYEIAQFVVPRIAADALDGARIRREAIASGIVAPRVEMNVRKAGAGKVRLTCRTVMALRLIAECGRYTAEGSQPNALKCFESGPDDLVARVLSGRDRI